MNLTFPALALSALAITVFAGATHADNWSKTYSIANHADLEVHTDDGDVTINSSPGQKQISAHVTTEGYKIGPSDVRIDESQSGDHVIVTVKAPHMNMNFFGGVRHSIHVQLSVPRDLDLEVSTGDGAVNLDPLNGHLQIRTGDGAIHANGLHGNVGLHTGDGSIDGNDFDGAIDANTGDGSIHISGRFDSLAVNTGDGSVDANAATGSKMNLPWTLHSGDGSINLHIPKNFSAFVDLKTGDGKITLDVPVTVEGQLDHSHIRGNLNGGGSELKIASGDGSIHLMSS